MIGLSQPLAATPPGWRPLLRRRPSPAAEVARRWLEAEQRQGLAARLVAAQQLPLQVEACVALSLRQAGASASHSLLAARLARAHLDAAGYFAALAPFLARLCDQPQLTALVEAMEGPCGAALAHLRQATLQACESDTSPAPPVSRRALRDFAALYRLLYSSRPGALALPQHAAWLLGVYRGLGAGAAPSLAALQRFASSPTGQHYLNVVRPAVGRFSSDFVRRHRLDSELPLRLSQEVEAHEPS